MSCLKPYNVHCHICPMYHKTNFTSRIEQEVWCVYMCACVLFQVWSVCVTAHTQCLPSWKCTVSSDLPIQFSACTGSAKRTLISCHTLPQCYRSSCYTVASGVVRDWWCIQLTLSKKDTPDGCHVTYKHTCEICRDTTVHIEKSIVLVSIWHSIVQCDR